MKLPTKSTRCGYEYQYLTEDRAVLTNEFRAWAEPLVFQVCNAAHSIRSNMRLWGSMVEANYDTAIGDSKVTGNHDKQVQSELANVFGSADNDFGGLEGYCRDLISVLRVVPNTNFPRVQTDPNNDETRVEQSHSAHGVDMIMCGYFCPIMESHALGLFDATRLRGVEAEQATIHIADAGLNHQVLKILDLINVIRETMRALGRGFFFGKPQPSPPMYAALSFHQPTASEEACLQRWRRG